MELKTHTLFTDANLVAYYRFEDNANDSKASFNLTEVDTPTYVAGKYGKAISFNGSSEYCVIHNNLGITGTSNNVTFSAWIKPLSQPGDDVSYTITFLQVINGATRYLYRYYYGKTGGVYYLIMSGRGNYVVTLNTDQWYHVVFTSDTSDNNKMYINGVEVYSNTASDTASVGITTNEFSIGATYFDAGSIPNLANLAIDDVAVFSKTLSPTEVLSLYNESNMFALL